jgi:HK97 family phage major capsid protein
MKEGLMAEQKNGINAVETKYNTYVSEINEKVAKLGGTLEDVKTLVDAINAKGNAIKAGTEEAKTFSEKVNAALIENIKQFEGQDANWGRHSINFNVKAFDTKSVADMTLATHHTGNVYLNQLTAPPPRGSYNHMRGILSVLPSAFDTIDYPREVVPAGEGSFGPTAEGVAKNQMDYDTLMIQLALDYETGYVTVGRQSLKNLPFLQQYINNNLFEDFQRREDIKYLNSLASLATSGSSSATYTAEKMIDFSVQVFNAGYNANGILTTGAGWAQVLKTKPSDFSVPGGIVISPSGDIMVAGLPVYKSQSVTAGRMYVADWTKAFIVQGSSFNIRTSEHHSDNFTKNKVTILAEAPVGLAVTAPSAFVYGTLGS